MKPTGTSTTKRRRKTRVWHEGPGDFRYEVIHPDGHEAAGSGFKTKAAAAKAAKAVWFGPRENDDQPTAREG